MTWTDTFDRAHSWVLDPDDIELVPSCQLARYHGWTWLKCRCQETERRFA